MEIYVLIILNENAPHSSIGEISWFAVIMQGYNQQESCRKKLIKANIFKPTHNIHQVSNQVISIVFVLHKLFWMTKNVIKKIRWNRLCIFFCSKPAKSYLWGINKLPDKWQQVNQNVSEYSKYLNPSFVHEQIIFYWNRTYLQLDPTCIYIYIYIYIHTLTT